MDCKILWNTLSAKEWENRLYTIARLPLLQSIPYAQAMRHVHQQNSRFGLIMIDDEEAGICTIQEVGLLRNLIHGLSLDRGPVWFEGFGSNAHWEAFLKSFNEMFPRRYGRKRRLIAELEASPAHETLMRDTGWQLKPQSKQYQTIWLDLSPSLEELRSNLKQKWRNALNKSESRKLVLDIDKKGGSLDILIKNYMADRLKKNYAGASAKMVKALSSFAIAREECLIFNAFQGGDLAASILVFEHGRSATYQIGWSGTLGRDSNAHYFLLWQAIGYLKEQGVSQFDLGGVNDESAAGVKAFKSGLNGHEITLIGHYD